MPSRLPSPCRHPGCAALTLTGYCSDHRPRIDYELRPDKKFYQTSAWKRLRLLKLHNDPLCVLCQSPASVVDHITPIAIGGRPSDLNNLQSMCEDCHNRKRAREGRERKY